MQLDRRVALVCSLIPPGMVASYGQIAQLCGCPRAARQVGRALGRGVSGAAHRVVNCRGELSGAAAFLVAGIQQQMLEAEGVEFLQKGRVDMKRFAWLPSRELLARLEERFRRAGI